MHTLQTTRRRGFGGQMLRHIITEARARSLKRLSLETGSWDYFKPAHALYQAHGFVLSGPFEGYAEDPNSLFLTLELDR
jgi:putative acetyltransferase